MEKHETDYSEKIETENSKSTNYVRNYARYTMLKNRFLWFAFGGMAVMRISK